MFGGLTVALVTGVPFGADAGAARNIIRHQNQTADKRNYTQNRYREEGFTHFGWRETFLAVSILGVIALVSSLILVPNNIPGRGPAR
jgi:DHA1 family inner membrane transport protein